MTEWTKCKERMPEEYGEYLIVRNGEVLCAKRQYLLVKDIWNVDFTGGFSIISDGEVTHWMPLPDAPKDD